jgi:hypothetical protein
MQVNRNVQTPSQAAKSAICNKLKKEEYLRDSMLRVLYSFRAGMASASIGSVLAVWHMHLREALQIIMEM